MKEQQLPLEGKTCLITREQRQAQPLKNEIEKLGGIPIVIPLIAFRKSKLTKGERAILSNLRAYQWFVFTSQNGVEYFFTELKEQGLAFPQGAKVAAVGTKTAKLLQNFGVTATLVPEKFTGEWLASEMLPLMTDKDSVCVIKGNLARDIVGKSLTEQGISVSEIIIYETYFPTENKSALLAAMQNKTLDLLIFTSPSTVKNFIETLIENDLLCLVKSKWIACIGSVTKQQAEDYGLIVHICPEIYTTDQLMQEIAAFFSEKANYMEESS
ncbi:uroporphyrinogen-III synthase [Bacillus kwashiorkori]|uniref:uroporphyrinogen-III synthase n=1 Tax=Bacillus kwashiorkori TaxID=1522318 RepID=UPI0007845C50|nr:uroporphyrinogen-III synthase [Bacillus kwashiorkori]